jgi:hypothetical protein
MCLGSLCAYRYLPEDTDRTVLCRRTVSINYQTLFVRYVFENIVILCFAVRFKGPCFWKIFIITSIPRNERMERNVGERPGSHVNVTIHGVWIDDLIYWTLWYSAWLQLTGHYYIYTSVHSHVFTAVTWYWLPKADVPEIFPASATSLSQQQIKMTDSQQFSH